MRQIDHSNAILHRVRRDCNLRSLRYLQQQNTAQQSAEFHLIDGFRTFFEPTVVPLLRHSIPRANVLILLRSDPLNTSLLAFNVAKSVLVYNLARARALHPRLP